MAVLVENFKDFRRISYSYITTEAMGKMISVCPLW